MPAIKQRTERIPVKFDLECDSFRVPSLPGLDFGGTVRFTAVVERDHSGDWTTPDGPDGVLSMGSELVDCSISRGNEELCACEERRIVASHSVAIAAALVAAKGGLGAVEFLAIERIA